MTTDESAVKNSSWKNESEKNMKQQTCNEYRRLRAGLDIFILTSGVFTTT